MAPAIVKLIASFAVSITQTLRLSPPNNRWERDENIEIPTPNAKPIPAPSVIPISTCLPSELIIKARVKVWINTPRIVPPKRITGLF